MCSSSWLEVSYVWLLSYICYFCWTTLGWHQDFAQFPYCTCVHKCRISSAILVCGGLSASQSVEIWLGPMVILASNFFIACFFCCLLCLQFAVSMQTLVRLQHVRVLQAGCFVYWCFSFCSSNGYLAINLFCQLIRLGGCSTCVPWEGTLCGS